MDDRARMTVAGGNRRLVRQFYDAIGRNVVDALGGEEARRAGDVLDGSVTDDFECVMVAPFGSFRYHGLAGFAEAWRDWVEPYSSFSIQIDDLEEREDRVLMLVRQLAVTRRDQVEIENASAAVWRFREGKLARAEFYLVRDAAREAFETGS
jgi:ketosteroid isomerase-like protein